MVPTHAQEPTHVDDGHGQAPIWGDDQIADLADSLVAVVVNIRMKQLRSTPAVGDDVDLLDGDAERDFPGNRGVSLLRHRAADQRKAAEDKQDRSSGDTGVHGLTPGR